MKLSSTGYCLDASTAVAGAELQVQPCSGAAKQKFTYDSANKLLKGTNNLCIDVYAGQMANMNFLNLYTCDANNANQKFTLTSTSAPSPSPAPAPAPAPAPSPAPASAAVGGVYNIRPNLNTGFCADLDKAAAVPGARFIFIECISGNANQAFSFASTGEVKLHGYCLDASTAVAGAQLQVQPCSGAAKQKFTYDSTNKLLKGTNNLCIDVYAGQMVNMNLGQISILVMQTTPIRNLLSPRLALHHLALLRLRLLHPRLHRPRGEYLPPITRTFP